MPVSGAAVSDWLAKRRPLLGRSFCFQLELTRSASIHLNERVSLHGTCETHSFNCAGNCPYPDLLEEMHMGSS
jgi:hypothetical protein